MFWFMNDFDSLSAYCEVPDGSQLQRTEYGQICPLPGLTGFSETNIKNMRIFYEAWSPVLNRQMSSADFEKELNVSDLLNRQMPSADLSEADYDCFLKVGFSNHREILRNTSTLEERLF